MKKHGRHGRHERERREQIHKDFADRKEGSAQAGLQILRSATREENPTLSDDYLKHCYPGPALFFSASSNFDTHTNLMCALEKAGLTFSDYKDERIDSPTVDESIDEVLYENNRVVKYRLLFRTAAKADQLAEFLASDASKSTSTDWILKKLIPERGNPDPGRSGGGRE